MKLHRTLFTLMLLGFAVTNTFAADAGRGGFNPGELWLDDKGIYIDLQAGSRGQLSLNAATEENYIASVKSGHIRLNGQPTTPDKFRFVNLPPQGIYILATA